MTSDACTAVVRGPRHWVEIFVHEFSATLRHSYFQTRGPIAAIRFHYYLKDCQDSKPKIGQRKYDNISMVSAFHGELANLPRITLAAQSVLRS